MVGRTFVRWEFFLEIVKILLSFVGFIAEIEVNVWVKKLISY